MHGKTIALIWVTGLALALALYAIGPDRFVSRLFYGVEELSARLQDAIFLLGTQAFEAMRAMAIAFYVVFVALATVASRRGVRARAALLLVSALFLLLLLGPGSGTPTYPDRWMEAFVLAAVGAGVMTQRLIAAGR